MQSSPVAESHHFDEIGAPIWRCDAEGRCEFFNRAWLDFTGKSLEEEIDNDWGEGLHPDDRESCLRVFQNALERKSAFEMEYRLRHRDGSYHWILDLGRPSYDDEQRFCGFVGTCFDITQRKRSEEALRESERRFRGIFDSTFQFIGLISPSGILLEANKTALDFVDLKIEDVVGRPFTQARWWSYSAEVQSRLQRAIERASRGELVRYEVDVCGAEGEMRTIDFSLKPVRDEQGRVELIIPEGRDLTERRQVERAWRSVVQGTSGSTGMTLFKQLVHHLAGALGVAYAYVGELIGPAGAHVRTLAVSADGHPAPNFEYALADTPCENVVGNEVQVYADAVQQAFPRDRLLVGMGIRSYAGIPLFDAGHRPLGLLVVLDREPMRQTELVQSILTVFGARVAAEMERQKTGEQNQQHLAELAHVARISTVGEMATSLAHELNQPLTAIVNYARGAVRRLEDPGTEAEALRGVLSQIAQQAERAGQVIHHLRALVGKHEVVRERVCMQEVVRQAVSITQPEARRAAARLVLELDEDLPPVTADPVQLEQVLINLILNAVEAMAEGTDGPRTVIVQGGVLGKDEMRLSVIDRGPGLAPETEERIFKPFYSTKERGMGMGLNISRGIVEAHGGRLWAEPNPKGGVAFHLRLPCAEPEEVAP